jgi:signal transduction histidine kinase
MKTKLDYVDQSLKLEVAKKGQASCISFAIFAIFTIIYGFEVVTFLPHIQIIASFILLNAIIRIFLSLKLTKKNCVSKKEWNQMVFHIWFNALGWSIVLNLVSFELKMSGTPFIVLITLLSGIVGSSIVTLSYFSYLFIPFQTLLLLPQIGLILYFSLGKEHMPLLPLTILYIMYFFYQLKQFKSYRGQQVKLFTYQVELEEKNREIVDQTVKLVHTSRLAALGEMSAGLAHEVNNPLAIISGNINVIKKQLLNEDDHKFDREVVSNSINKINKSIERVNKIIHGLKHLSKQSDQLPKEIVLIDSIVEETLFFCAELLQSQKIQFKINPMPLLKVNCHPTQISQVLINLIKNAADYLNELDEISDKWINISVKGHNSNIIITVSNGGSPISKEIESKLFDAFFTTKGAGKGTGLGLSICKNIILEHNGKLFLDTTMPNTTFVIELPEYHD